MRCWISLIVSLLCATIAVAQQPMYVVNGVVVDGIDSIAQSDIESIDVLPADEETIAQWGMAASEGVIVVRLIYDTPARFSYEGTDNFTTYLSKHVKWGENMPAERVSLRITIDTEGVAHVSEVLDSTSRQYLKRVMKAIDEAPRWQPAMRDGKPIESLHLVNLQLPVGKEIPAEQFVIIL